MDTQYSTRYSKSSGEKDNSNSITLVSKDEELSEDELEQIAGGGFFGTAWKVLRSVGCTIATPVVAAFETVMNLGSCVICETCWGYDWTVTVAGGVVSPWKE